MPAAALHAEVDVLVERLTAHHGERLTCRRGCHDCCKDGIRVFTIEAERIALEYAHVLDETPHAIGACAFLDAEGACRIYEARPYVCRTQGLPLRWLDQDEQGEVVEYRDICALNEAGPPLAALPPEACWPLGPAETKLAALQEQAHGDGERVALRELFRTG